MNIEDIEREIESTEIIDSEGLTDAQTAYLKELDIPSDRWEAMDDPERMEKMSAITGRFSEIKLPMNFSIKNGLVNFSVLRLKIIMKL